MVVLNLDCLIFVKFLGVFRIIIEFLVVMLFLVVIFMFNKGIWVICVNFVERVNVVFK